MALAVDDTGDGAGAIPPVPFYFLRKCETDWNGKHRLEGAIDAPHIAAGPTPPSG